MLISLDTTLVWIILIHIRCIIPYITFCDYDLFFTSTFRFWDLSCQETFLFLRFIHLQKLCFVWTTREIRLTHGAWETQALPERPRESESVIPWDPFMIYMHSTVWKIMALNSIVLKLSTLLPSYWWPFRQCLKF